MRRGPIIAVAGPPGAGKSRLTSALAALLEHATLVEWDAFETMTRQNPAAIAAWLDAGAPIDAVQAPGLAARLQAAAACGPVVFEAPFGRWHPETGAMIDFLIWLDADADLALARKLSQLLRQGGPAPDRIALLGYLDAYARIVRPAMTVQRARVRPSADLWVDAAQDPAWLDRVAAAAVRARFSGITTT